MIKVDTHTFVSGGKTVKDPVVHHLPQFTDFRIARFPVAEHLLSRFAQIGFEKKFIAVLIGKLRMSRTQSFDLFRKSLIEFHIEITDQMIAFDPG